MEEETVQAMDTCCNGEGQGRVYVQARASDGCVPEVSPDLDAFKRVHRKTTT